MSILDEIVIWEYMAGFDFIRVPGSWWKFMGFEILRSYS
jgi:hypothetical protein